MMESISREGPQDGRKKVVILGGGLGSLTTALALTELSDWRERFESITVYQMGWRLGGKGASGRNREKNDRIEEHGLHVWMGWYENAFRYIQRIYEELGRPVSAPLATWDEAFKRHNFIAVGEEVGGEWKNWPLEFPSDDDVPGTGGEFPSLWSYVELTLGGLFDLLKGSSLVAPKPSHRRDRHDLSPIGWLEYGFKRVMIALRRVLDLLRVGEEFILISAGEKLLKKAHRRAGEAARADAAGPHAERLHDLVEAFRKWLRHRIEHEIEAHDEARRLFYILDTGMACITGILAEGISDEAHALDTLDRYDFREFLSMHGVADDTVQSSLIRAFYDLLFAYRNGDPNDQLVGAGVAIRFIFRMCLTFKGAIFWKMQAGMGDTIFGPMYKVLKRRGVRFKLFHRIKNVGLSTDRRSVERILVGRQVTIAEGDYRPLFDVKGLPCWPSEPLYDQIVEGEALKAQSIDLESFWTPWDDIETFTLEKGRDFDVVVFGISLASIPFVAPELVAARTAWKEAVERVETVRTQAVQVWMKPDLDGLGWTLPGAVADAYAEPLDTWADMSHLLPRETWSDGVVPGNVTYFCAPMVGGIPPLDDADAPRSEWRKVRAAAADWFGKNTSVMWPKACDDDGSLDWEMLVDREDRQGEARLDAQFFRANIDPCERYVLSVPGSTGHRLRADASGFDNLVVTGDWTYTGINAGCVEATVISGMLASNALCGHPRIADVIGFSNP